MEEKNFWDRPAGEVAANVQYMWIIMGEQQLFVTNVDVFSRKENEKRKLYNPILTLSPGSVYCPKVQGFVMILIVTENGSCIRIKEAVLGNVEYDGPGKISRALGLSINRQKGVANFVDDNVIIVELVDVEGVVTNSTLIKSDHIPHLRKKLGKEIFKKYMSMIVKRYLLKHSSSVFLVDYLNYLNKRYKTEGELIKYLSSG